jgi:hypothetical protein
MRLVLGGLWLLFTLLAIASGAAYVRGLLRDLGFAMLSFFPALVLVNRGGSRILLWISGVLVAGVAALLVRRP